MSILAECPACHKKQSIKNKLCITEGCNIDLDKAKKSKRVQFWINFRVNGKQRREPVGYSIEEAKDANGKRRAQKREGKIFDMLPQAKTTFHELTKWYLKLESVTALASFWLVKLSIGKFNKVFGDRVISEMKVEDLQNYQARRKKDGIADATIDHEIGKTKTMIFRAFDNDRVGADTLRTFKKVKKMLKRGSDVRDRVLSRDEYDRLYQNLPIHLKPVIAMGYFAGMRKGEILGLTWDRLSLKARMVHLGVEHTKDREARDVPICDELLGILKAVPRHLHKNHVFLFQGEPFKDIRDGLRPACQKAGILYGRFKGAGFVFHDLRHSFVTNCRKAGVPESVIMKMTGHSTREMFDRYNRVDRQDLQNAVDDMQAFLKNVDQVLTGLPDVDQELKQTDSGGTS